MYVTDRLFAVIRVKRQGLLSLIQVDTSFKRPLRIEIPHSDVGRIADARVQSLLVGYFQRIVIYDHGRAARPTFMFVDVFEVLETFVFEM